MKPIETLDLDKTLALLTSVGLFTGVSKALLRTSLEKGAFSAVEYDAGEVICSPDDSTEGQDSATDENTAPLPASQRMVIFLEGHAEVYSADEHRAMLLRTVGAGGVVGVASLFSGECYVSRVIAAKKCRVLEIPAEKYGRLLEQDSRAMYNYVAFLSSRICYLNRKIVMLTAGSAERRLAYFLDSAVSEQDAHIPAEVTVQMNSLCEMLNLGRASLYRAADKLCEEGFIAREGKRILLLDRKGMMERYR